MTDILLDYINNPKLLVNRKVSGLFGSNSIYRVISIDENENNPEKYKISIVKLESNRFIESYIEKSDLQSIYLVSEYTFTRDPQQFFMYIMGMAIRSNFNQDYRFLQSDLKNQSITTSIRSGLSICAS